MLRQPPEREPFLHRNGGARLFAICHHPPAGQAARGGVVLCGPIGQEYFEYHKMMVLLADMIAGKGIPCLRFDYSGCGDSEGSIGDDGVRAWLTDISAMASALRARTNQNSVCLCGLRLGASLAATCGARNQAVDRLVLWDPVVDGRQYVSQLREDHRRRLAGTFARTRKADRKHQGLGFCCPDGFRRELQGLDLVTLQRSPAREILVLRNAAAKDQDALVRHLGELSAAVEVCPASTAALPLRPMRTVADWIAR